MKGIIFTCGLLFIFSFTWSQDTITTFILIRHAEKTTDGSDDPPLKPEGVERAKRLVQILSKTKIDAIYSTKFKRTRETVDPLAASTGTEVNWYDPSKNESIEQMLKDHPGGTIVVSGHSNNIPGIANFLTGTTQFKDYDDSDYGNILIVDVVVRGKSAKTTWLRY